MDDGKKGLGRARLMAFARNIVAWIENDRMCEFVYSQRFQGLHKDKKANVQKHSREARRRAVVLQSGHSRRNEYGNLKLKICEGGRKRS
jgi:hypothetical protein